jgi:phage/plasmid-like protein (TIGR03299 family)
MSHELEINKETGEASMFYVGDVPWHGLGTKLEAPPTSEEAIKAAKLDWTVETQPLFMDDPTYGKVAVPRRAVIRSTDRRLLGTVGEEWHPLQNVEAFKFFDPIVVAGEAQYHTAGALFEGSRVWVLAKLARAAMEIVPGDMVEKFLLLSNSHDGSLALRVGFTPIRVVCNNTLTEAHGSERSMLVKIRHTARVKDSLEAMREVINMTNARFEATAEQYRELAARDIDKDDLEKYVKIVFTPPKGNGGGSTPPTAPSGGNGTPPASEGGPATELAPAEEEASCKRILPKVTELFESGRGTEIKGVRGTWWGAYNAVTEYLTHERGKTQDARLNNLWFGDSVNINRRALENALRMANHS